MTKEQTPKHYWEYGQQDKATRRKYHTGDVLENAATCLECGEYIRSNNLHDYKSCGCGAIAVDGGSWYCKRVGSLESIQDHIIMYDDANSPEPENE